MVDENENFLEAAKRELLEETGYTTDIKHFELIGSTWPLPGLIFLQTRFIFVSNLEKVERKEHESSMEILEVVEVEKDELFLITKNNQGFIDGNFTSALYYLIIKLMNE